MEFQILGPLEVRGARGAVALVGIKPRAVLAVLLLHANEPVSAERLALALWGEDAPAGATKTVHVYVSRLRKALGDPAAIETTRAGYRLRVRPQELDAERFASGVEAGRQAVGDGRPEQGARLLREALALWRGPPLAGLRAGAAGRPEQGARLLREALALWRGPPLAELEFEPFAQAEIARLEEQRLAGPGGRVGAGVAAGRHAELVGERRQLVIDNPTRERLVGQLMLALYRSGRQEDALEAF